MWRRPPGEPSWRHCVTRGYDSDRLRAVRLERGFQVIHRNHRDTPLAAVSAPSRFSDPRARYAVETVRCPRRTTERTVTSTPHRRRRKTAFFRASATGTPTPVQKDGIAGLVQTNGLL